MLFRSLTIGGSRASAPLAATIVMSPAYIDGTNGNRVSNAITNGDGSLKDLSINANQFVMGLNEKLTAFGKLTVNATTSATLSDITSLGDLTVNSPSISIPNRSAGRVLSRFVHGDHAVTEAEGGLDFVSGGKIFFSSAPSGFARYAVADPSGGNINIQGGSGTFAPFAGGVSSALFVPKVVGTGTPGVDAPNGGTDLLALDLRAEGDISNVASAIASAIPSDQSLGVPNQNVSLSNAVRDLLLQIGISVKDSSSFDEAVNAATGLALYNDWPQTARVPADDASYKVSVNRLSKGNIDRVVSAYVDLFGEETAREDRIAEAQSVLKNAMEKYSASLGDREADGLGFRAFVEASPEQADALKVLNGLNRLFAAIDQLGLSPAEVRVPRTTIYRHFQDVLASKEQFWAAVTGQPVAEPAPVAQ